MKYQLSNLYVHQPEHRVGPTRVYRVADGYKLTLDTELNGVVIKTPKGESWLCGSNNYTWAEFAPVEEKPKAAEPPGVPLLGVRPAGVKAKR